jgi:hypothetical protein
MKRMSTTTATQRRTSPSYPTYLLLFTILIIIVDNDGFRPTDRTRPFRLSCRVALFAAKTEVSLTLPRFFRGEIENGSYPSPLHSIHVRSILSDDEVARCLRLAQDYAKKTGCWESPDLIRHATYSTCDFPIEDNQELADYLNYEINFDDRILGSLEELYGVDRDCMSYLDFFCAHYQARDETVIDAKTMDRLEAHRDGSLLSFTMLLNDPSEFEGGGTFFDGLRDVASMVQDDNPSLEVLHEGGVVRPLRAGDVTMHSGKLLHGADVITKGARTVLVGFVDVGEWLHRPGVLSQACRDWGRMDVATFHHKRQLERTNQRKKSGWVLNNDRWIVQNDKELGQGRSCLKGFIPAFSSVERRASPEFQRRNKLEAEDRLLRSILLGKDEVLPVTDLFDGDISVL